LAPRKRTIAILWHEKQAKMGFKYMVRDYAAIWQEDGHRVLDLIGPARFEPADLVLVHVDLSVVPEAYLELAARYPVAVNGRVRDIRKSRMSTLKVGPDDGWSGPVIVKADLNFAGHPERVFAAMPPAFGVWSERMRATEQYRVFESVAAVPQAVWLDAGVVVERFVPEREDGRYVTRMMVFVGEHATCAKNSGPKPIVNSSSQTHSEFVEPHPEILALRKTLGFDYGKFDYVIHEGTPILLDTNKTVGSGHVSLNPQRAAARRHRARGLYAYFEGQR
jgi:hypothetical protein